VKQILVLGAGFVARPLVAYLLEQESVEITVASRTLFKAENLVGGHPRGKAVQLDVEAASALDTLVSQSNVVISLLPWVHHLEVAKLCLAHGKHLVTTSYVKPEMEALDAEARAKGLLFLNEIGLDPGIDHMAAMRVMDEIRNTGGTVESFYSYCGGLPAPEHNTNPLGYKFSWSPTGVLLAAGNEGRYLEEGGIIEIPGSELFTHYWFVRVPGAGVYEAYVNRDALPYLEIYGIPEARSMYRGTLRNIGHCETWHLFKRMGLLDRDRTFDFSRFTPREVMARLIDAPGNDLPKELADYLQIPEYGIQRPYQKTGMAGTPERLPAGLERSHGFRDVRPCPGDETEIRQGRIGLRSTASRVHRPVRRRPYGKNNLHPDRTRDPRRRQRHGPNRGSARGGGHPTAGGGETDADRGLPAGVSGNL